MAKTLSIDPGLLKFEICDDEGTVYSTFKINPSDMQLGRRLKELEEFFSSTDMSFKTDDPEEIAKVEDVVTEQINKLLGYDCKNDAFGVIGACTVLPDGSFFFERIVEAITDEVPKAMEERARRSEEHVERYTKVYETSEDAGV